MTAPEANSAAAGPRSTPAAIAAARPAAASTSRTVAIRSACGLASARTGAPGRSVTSVAVASAAAPTAAAAAPTTAAAVAARRPLLALARRCVLGPLDQLLRLNEVAVLVLGDQLEADPAAILVDLLDEDVEHVAAPDHVLDVADAARADVGDGKQAVGSLLQLDEGAELRGLHDLARVGVADLRGLRERLDRCDRRVGLLTLGRVDQDRAVLLDVDLDVVVGLERADRLAAFADHEPDLLRVDLDRRDARSVRGELATALREHLGHLVEDELARPLRLRERVAHDLLRDAGDLDVHLQRGDPVARAGDLEVHVAEVILGSLDVGQDHVVVALLDEAHRDAADRRLDRHARILEREGRAADRAHRR